MYYEINNFLTGAEIRTQERISASTEVATQVFYKVQDLPQASKILFTNFSFIFIGLAEASEGIIMSGLAAFMPKMIENQFSMSAGKSAMIVGMIDAIF